jgi:hypothetical protein
MVIICLLFLAAREEQILQRMILCRMLWDLMTLICSICFAPLQKRPDKTLSAQPVLNVGGVLHFNIQSNATYARSPCTSLAICAMRAATMDKECQFVIVSTNEQFLPLIRSLQVPNQPSYNREQRSVILVIGSLKLQVELMCD